MGGIDRIELGHDPKSSDVAAKTNLELGLCFVHVDDNDSAADRGISTR